MREADKAKNLELALGEPYLSNIQKIFYGGCDPVTPYSKTVIVKRYKNGVMEIVR